MAGTSGSASISLGATSDTATDRSSVVKVRVTAERLVGYDAAVAAQTERYVAQLEPGDLDRVVDERWTPAVTLGVRLVSVISDCLQHLGQAAYVRGLL
jgi:hypothetical protein